MIALHDQRVFERQRRARRGEAVFEHAIFGCQRSLPQQLAVEIETNHVAAAEEREDRSPSVIGEGLAMLLLVSWCKVGAVPHNTVCQSCWPLSRSSAHDVQILLVRAVGAGADDDLVPYDRIGDSRAGQRHFPAAPDVADQFSGAPRSAVTPFAAARAARPILADSKFHAEQCNREQKGNRRQRPPRDDSPRGVRSFSFIQVFPPAWATSSAWECRLLARRTNAVAATSCW